MSKILVVDDEGPVRDLLMTFFEERGYNVTGAKDGQEALDLARRLKPEVIFLDIAMPGLDGIETLKRLRRERPASNVIMMSGQADQEAAQKALDLGAFDFIQKPFDLNYLQSVVLLKMSLTN